MTDIYLTISLSTLNEDDTPQNYVFFPLRSKSTFSINPRIKWFAGEVFLFRVLGTLCTKSAKRTDDGEVVFDRQQEEIFKFPDGGVQVFFFFR